MSAILTTSGKKIILRWLEDVSTQMERFAEDWDLEALNDPDDWRTVTGEWQSLAGQVREVRRALGDPVWD